MNTSVPEVMEQIILLDPNDPNIDPQLQSYLYHTLVQIAQHHPSATSELKNLSQSTAVNRGFQGHLFEAASHMSQPIAYGVNTYVEPSKSADLPFSGHASSVLDGTANYEVV
eukprot:jgi/Tetstr1/453654/TSEL_040610.t1